MCNIVSVAGAREREREMFYLTTHSTHFIYGYMASDIWLRTILTVRKETRCRHIGYSFRLAARVLLYAPSHRQDSTYHGSMGPPHEGSIRRPIAPWANALTTELYLAPPQAQSHARNIKTYSTPFIAILACFPLITWMNDPSSNWKLAIGCQTNGKLNAIFFFFFFFFFFLLSPDHRQRIGWGAIYTALHMKYINILYNSLKYCKCNYVNIKI